MAGHLFNFNIMWKYAAAKVTGISHLRSDLPCQDYYECHQINEFFVFALADGAGSAKFGKEGAENTVSTFIETLDKTITPNDENLKKLVKDALYSSREKIKEIAKENQRKLRDYASTFLAVVLSPNKEIAVQIGDGVIATSDGNGTWDLATWPQHGEYINSTSFITDDDAEDKLFINEIQTSVSDLIIMSDGLERLALNFAERKPHDPFFNGFIRELIKYDDIGEIIELSSQLEIFLSSEKFTSRTDDDLSLIIASAR